MVIVIVIDRDNVPKKFEGVLLQSGPASPQVRFSQVLFDSVRSCLRVFTVSTKYPEYIIIIFKLQNR